MKLLSQNKLYQPVALKKACSFTMRFLPSMSICCAILMALGLLSAPVQAGTGTPASEGIVTLALQYEHGEGIARDYLRAASLYCTAARAGDANALYGLGWMYANGRGMPVDDSFAAHLFRMAAAAGHLHAPMLAERFLAPANAELPPCLNPEPENTMVDPRMAAAQRGTPDDAAPSRDLRNISGAKIHQLVSKLAPRYQVDVNLAMAIIYMESGFNVNARSPKNAQGLMQLIPDTAQRFNVKNAYDAEDNIKGGLSYLRWLLAYFKGDVALVAAAYNAGEGAVERYKGVPPYAETRAYVAKLAQLYRRASHPFDAGATARTATFASTKSAGGIQLISVH